MKIETKTINEILEILKKYGVSYTDFNYIVVPSIESVYRDAPLNVTETKELIF